MSKINNISDMNKSEKINPNYNNFSQNKILEVPPGFENTKLINKEADIHSSVISNNKEYDVLNYLSNSIPNINLYENKNEKIEEIKLKSPALPIKKEVYSPLFGNTLDINHIYLNSINNKSPNNVSNKALSINEEHSSKSGCEQSLSTIKEENEHPSSPMKVTRVKSKKKSVINR